MHRLPTVARRKVAATRRKLERKKTHPLTHKKRGDGASRNAVRRPADFSLPRTRLKNTDRRNKTVCFFFLRSRKEKYDRSEKR
jgi:hypothetical protein